MSEMLIEMTMTADAAKVFQDALNYAACVLDAMADEAEEPRATQLEVRAGWLRWGHGRTQMALDATDRRGPKPLEQREES